MLNQASSVSSATTPSTSSSAYAAANRCASSRSLRRPGQRGAVAVPGGQHRRHRRPRPLQGAVHRRLAGVEHARDLRGTEAEGVAQQQDRALPRRQVLDGGDERQRDRLLRLIARVRPGGGVGQAVEQGVRVRLQPDRLAPAGRLGRRRTAARAAPAGGGGRWRAARSGERLVAIRYSQVRSDGAALVLAEAAPGREQGLLQHVLGVLHRAEDPVAVQPQFGQVRTGEFAEGLIVSGAGPLQRGVGCHTCTDTGRGGKSSLNCRGRPGVCITDDTSPGGNVGTEGKRLMPGQGWVLALTSVASFMVSLDTQVVATALPVIRVHLHASLAALEWTVNAYTLSFAVLLLTGAALGERLGRRRMLAFGIGLFTAASAACALAPNAGALVAARAVPGSRRGAGPAAGVRPAVGRVPAAAPGLGDRHLQRGDRPGGGGRSDRGRRGRAGHRLAVDFLAERPVRC